MAIVNSDNLNAGVIIGNVQAVLKAHRAALNAINDMWAWSSGVTAADLQAAPLNMTQALLSAIADAHAEYLIHTTGLPPATYPQPPQAYVYANSQTAEIGPQ